jgi:uncharacterized protein (DUF1499 family)
MNQAQERRGRGTAHVIPPLLKCALVAAFVAVVLLLAAGPGYRLSLWMFRTGFTILACAAWIGLGAALLALLQLVVSAVERMWRTVAVAVIAFLLGAVAFVLPYDWKRSAQNLPKIHDISTDTVNPPRFVAILPLRAHVANPPDYGGAQIAKQQVMGYPDIAPLVLAAPVDQVFGRALDTAQRMGWHVVAAEPLEGRIEASDTTFWFGFTDDIVIRITPSGNVSRLDIRSVSRVGLSDVGTNARRIRKFLALMR